MSIFSDNITNENIPLQKFYNLCKAMIERGFNIIYKNFDGDLFRVSSVYNGALDRGQHEFAKYGMYHPWLSCIPVVGVNPFESKVLVTILYSEDPSIYIHEDCKVFLQTTIPILQLKDII